MSGLSYDDAFAERLEAIYLGPDVTAQRAETLRRLALQPGERVLDIGSGPGFLSLDMAEAVGPSGRVRGIDVSPAMVARASARNPHAWLSYGEADATALPEPDRTHDVVVSTQVAEYVPDIAAFCAEAHRILRPGGRGLILATDWDTIAWYSENPARMARMLDAFRSHCADSHLPRTLAPRLRAAGFAITGVSVFPIVNLDWDEGCYSQRIVPFIASFVRSQGTVEEAEIEAWVAELSDLAASGRHFFASNRFLFEVARPSSP